MKKRKHFPILSCEKCNKKFAKNWGSDRFCSRKCYWAAKVKYPKIKCPICDKKFKPKAKEDKQGKPYVQKFCSKICSGKAHSGEHHPLAVPGNRMVNHFGYISVPDPKRRNKSGRILEHRLIMEKIIGRPLKRSEHIHHINGIKSDNRPENLQLVDNLEHQQIHTELKRKKS